MKNPPRYDDVYFEGVAWLDSVAEDDFPELNQPYPPDIEYDYELLRAR